MTDAIVKAIVRELEPRFGAIGARFGEIDARLGAIDVRFAAVESKLGRLMMLQVVTLLAVIAALARMSWV
jgi:hypothetical protein